MYVKQPTITQCTNYFIPQVLPLPYNRNRLLLSVKKKKFIAQTPAENGVN